MKDGADKLSLELSFHHLVYEMVTIHWVIFMMTVKKKVTRVAVPSTERPVEHVTPWELC